MMDAGLITVDHFGEVDIRIGTVKSVKINKSARKAAYVLQVDCGPLGIKATSAQITELYRAEDLIGKQVVAVLNFPPKRVGDVKSEVLVLAAVEETGRTVLLKPTHKVENGAKVA